MEQANRYEGLFVGISLDSRVNTAKYAKEKSLSYPIFYPRDKDIFKEKNKIIGIPVTLITDEAGFVEKVWNGLLSDSEQADIVEALSVNKLNPN